MEIRTEGGNLLDTRNLPNHIDPVFCCSCGGRLGWADTDFLADTFVGWCDDCVAQVDEHDLTSE